MATQSHCGSMIANPTRLETPNGGRGASETCMHGLLLNGEKPRQKEEEYFPKKSKNRELRKTVRGFAALKVAMASWEGPTRLTDGITFPPSRQGSSRQGADLCPRGCAKSPIDQVQARTNSRLLRGDR
ncbi:hypothetical protein An11g00030 [Aspergillus niger]|uniref:Uncharacterized protein n=2 Tax=Aspergillus niger TaxID=5061 RepID=A5ABD8_ASPNC|nr:hypothetical protein An11g00030 [Aspergillus niger]CAK48236.1 hypothetical protein An11g00030 [Aspergillus niger]